jgi:pimeloyl-ACP methyl ester carboxylesterase
MTIQVSDSFVAVPGGNIFVRKWDCSPGGKTPIVLLHDSLGSVDMWREFPAIFASKSSRTIIAYDRLGFGRSSRRTDAPSIDFIAKEAEVYFPSVVRGLGLDAHILFGHSVGGAMALSIAAHAPERCKAVMTEAAQAFVEARTLSGIRAAKQEFENASQFSRLVKWHGERAGWVLAAWTEVWLAPEFRNWSLDACLPLVRCPVLAIHGDTDEYGSCEFPRRIAEGVGGPSRMEIIACCGHIPHREKEDEVLRLAITFLGTHAIP